MRFLRNKVCQDTLDGQSACRLSASIIARIRGFFKSNPWSWDRKSTCCQTDAISRSIFFRNPPLSRVFRETGRNFAERLRSAYKIERAALHMAQKSCCVIFGRIRRPAARLHAAEDERGLLFFIGGDKPYRVLCRRAQMRQRPLRITGFCVIVRQCRSCRIVFPKLIGCSS